MADSVIDPRPIGGFAATMGPGGVVLVMLRETFTLNAENQLIGKPEPLDGFVMHHDTAAKLVNTLGGMLGLEVTKKAQN